MKRFEYKFKLDLGYDPSNVENRTEESLNLLGSDGWELVSVGSCGKNNSYSGFYFKRPIE